MTKRRKALEDFQCDLRAFARFLEGRGQKAPIQIVDPEQELFEFAGAVQNQLDWVSGEIEAELARENELLPDEGNPGYAIGV